MKKVSRYLSITLFLTACLLVAAKSATAFGSAAISDIIMVENGTNLSLGTVAPGHSLTYNVPNFSVICATTKHVSPGPITFTQQSALASGSLGSTSELQITASMNIPATWPADGASCPSYPQLVQQGSLVIKAQVPVGAVSGVRTMIVTFGSTDPDLQIVPSTWFITYTVAADTTPPVITIVRPAQGAVYNKGQTIYASWSATDAQSGVKTATGTVPSGSKISTGTIGTKTFTVTATDNAGNTSTKSVTYTVK